MILKTNPFRDPFGSARPLHKFWDINLPSQIRPLINIGFNLQYPKAFFQPQWAVQYHRVTSKTGSIDHELSIFSFKLRCLGCAMSVPSTPPSPWYFLPYWASLPQRERDATQNPKDIVGRMFPSWHWQVWRYTFLGEWPSKVQARCRKQA